MNKKIPTLIAFAIIIALAVLLSGGIFAYQYWQTVKVESDIADNKKEGIKNAAENQCISACPKLSPQTDAILKDVGIKSNMNMLKMAILTWTMKKNDWNNESYSGLSCEVDETISRLCDGLQEEAGVKPTIHASEKEYCTYIKLFSPNEYFCVDSDGNTGETAINPAVLGYCDGKTFACPFITNFKSGTIKDDIGRIRTSAEIHFVKNNDSYSTLQNNPDIIRFKDDINNQGGDFKIVNSEKSFCISSKLKEGGFWCTDNTLYMGAPTNGTNCQTIGRCR